MPRRLSEVEIEIIGDNEASFRLRSGGGRMPRRLSEVEIETIGDNEAALRLRSGGAQISIPHLSPINHSVASPIITKV